MDDINRLHYRPHKPGQLIGSGLICINARDRPAWEFKLACSVQCEQ